MAAEHLCKEMAEREPPQAIQTGDFVQCISLAVVQQFIQVQGGASAAAAHLGFCGNQILLQHFVQFSQGIGPLLFSIGKKQVIGGWLCGLLRHVGMVLLLRGRVKI